jgi:hypothetical protein
MEEPQDPPEDLLSWLAGRMEGLLEDDVIDLDAADEEPADSAEGPPRPPM